MSTVPNPKLVGPGEGKIVKLFGVRFGYKVVSADSGGNLAMLEIEIPAKTLVKPHTHTREDEYSLVLSGTVGLRVGDDVREAGQGSYLVKPRGVPHAMWNAGTAPATVIEILSPGGLEDYFEELAPVLAHEGGAGAKEYYELAENYGITIEDAWIEELERTYDIKL
jgi:quercetin dioxygenase-like cupin family protein